MKNILITGGTSGIGLATAKLLANSDPNTHVIITGSHDKKMQQALAELPKNCTGYIADNINLDSINNLAQRIKSNHQSLQGVFINAGICEFVPFAETTDTQFHKMMMVNFKSAYFTLQKLLPYISDNSSIVFTSSIVTQKAFSNTSVYTASKSALEGLASVLNVELQPRKIRVNMVAPGVTLTSVFERAGMSDEQINAICDEQKSNLLGRIIMPEDIAGAVCFLLSSQSEAMRNARLVVDGGLTV